jgi:hypothetical protein
MRRVAAGLVLASVVGVLAGRVAVAGRLSAENRLGNAGLRGGARSVDQLVGRFLRALRAKDRGALRALRMTEQEYREIVLPGSVPPGEPPRQYAAEFAEFLWGSLDARNFHGERGLIEAYGAKALTLRATSFAGGAQEFASYRSHGRLDLAVTDDRGNEAVLEMGSVAQVGDRYKFVSFVRD